MWQRAFLDLGCIQTWYYVPPERSEWAALSKGVTAPKTQLQSATAIPISLKQWEEAKSRMD